MRKDFLPIGTVVLLKNATKKIMITGYLPKAKDKEEFYDYSACLFPEGIISNKQTAVFNNEQIAEIIQIGYKNEETDKFVNALNEIVNEENKKNAGQELPKEIEPKIPEEILVNNTIPELPVEPQQAIPQENETLEMPNMPEDQSNINKASMPIENVIVQDNIQPVPEQKETLDMPQPAAPTVGAIVEENKNIVEPSTTPEPISFANNEPIGMEAIKPFSE